MGKSHTPYDTRPFILLRRAKYLHLNDPRCYNGAYFDAEHRWGPFEELDRLDTMEEAERGKLSWVELNDYAVSQRGEGSRHEFKIEANTLV
jgi:hypothetical protein